LGEGVHWETRARFKEEKMPEELIPSSPADKSEQKAPKRGKSKSKASPSGGPGEAQPRGARRRPQRIPQPAELIDQLRELAGLAAMGIVPTDKANFLLRCLSKIADISLKCPAMAGEIENQEGLVEACRQNPKLVGLVESFLTDDQLSELTRQITENGP
jgi:hypothetical protein